MNSLEDTRATRVTGRFSGEGLLTVPEAAERLKVSRSKGWQLAQRNEIPVIRIGRSVRVPVDALEQWIKERTEVAA